jgi:integrase
MRVADVTTEEVEALHAQLTNIKIMGNSMLALISTIMRFAVKRKLRTDNPCAGIKRYPENARIVHTTREQLDRLYTALEQHPNRSAVNAVKLLMWTGSRRSEVLGARWTEFDLARGLWHKPAERLKQKRASTIPLNPLALKLLHEMHAATTGDLLFPAVKDHTRPMHRELRTLWLQVSKQAGLETLRVHDLRHVFATTALEAGAPLITIAPLLGHSNTVMTQRYAHISNQMLLEATTKAGNLLALPELPAARPKIAAIRPTLRAVSDQSRRVPGV